MKLKVSLILFFYATIVNAFVFTKTEYQKDIKWSPSGSVIVLEINPEPKGVNISGISSSNITNILNESIDQWNAHSKFQIIPQYSSSISDVGVTSTFRFSDNPSYFGSGVLAITSIGYTASTGLISSADIIINDSINNFSNFTDNKSLSSGVNSYLGDVFTHELGHFLGLGHSETYGSSMVYSVFKGQYDIHQDDITAVKKLYSHNQKSGVLRGTIVGGSLVPIFGAQVQAISYNSGKVVSGVISDGYGNFEIGNLALNDSYMIYVLPPKMIETMPSYYASIQTRYCSGNAYRPSFFTKCGGHNQGKPQVLALDSINYDRDVGNITVRCDSNIDRNYLLEKFTDIRSEVSVFYANTYDNTLGETFVGNFSESEIADELTGQGDKLIYDLTNYEVPNDDTFYFDLKVISEQIGSAFGFYISVERADGVNYGPYTLASDIMTGKRILDQNIRIPLSLTTSNNSFVVSIHPTELNSTEKNELFASYTALANTENTYLALSGISIHGPEGFEMVHMKNSAPYDDNTYCTDGNVNYTTQPNNTITVSESMGQTNEDQGGISCGTLDISGGGGPGGPLSFVFGLSSILLMGLCSRKSNEFFV